MLKLLVKLLTINFILIMKTFVGELHTPVWFFLSSPHSHLAVHHTREIKLCQQILHLVVFLTVLLYVSMVTGDIWAQHIPHQEGQTALLTFTVFLSGEKKQKRPHQNSQSEAAHASGDLRESDTYF